MEKEKTVKDNLLVYGGHIEFGWMLQFIARARYKAQGFRAVEVHCEEPFAYLYSDFATKIFTHPVLSGRRDRWLYDGLTNFCPVELSENDYPFYPTEKRCKRPEAKWFKYGNKIEDDMELLIHARNLPKVHYDKKFGKRNWPENKWEEFSIHNACLDMASIGSIEGAMHISGTWDGRGRPIKELCDLMASAKCIVGPSSGPLHLAALCGCPVVVWTHKHKEKSLDGKTNRWRYEKGWNPFNTPVTVIDDMGWDPSVERVMKAVRKYL